MFGSEEQSPLISYDKSVDLEQVIHMQNILIKKMNDGVPNNQTSNRSKMGLLENKNDSIHHETIFIPYYTENKNSALDR